MVGYQQLLAFYSQEVRGLGVHGLFDDGLGVDKPGEVS